MIILERSSRNLSISLELQGFHC
ncbi:unnamed protein product [Victoria cruziana]